MDGPRIYGREMDLENVVKILLADSSSSTQDHVSIVPIIGRGGIGKTTLAKMVCNDHRIKQRFDVRGWVSMSKGIDILTVTKELLMSFNSKYLDCIDPSVFQHKVTEEILGKRFLIVLDDVSFGEQNIWCSLLPRLVSARSGKILATARSPQYFTGIPTARPYQLFCLSTQDNFSIFKEFHPIIDRVPNLPKFGRSIVEKCAGVPLSVKVLGGVLRFQRDEIVWSKVLASKLWLHMQPGDIYPALVVGFDFMPSALKQCFAFFSLLTENHVFSKDDMVLLWMSLIHLLPQGDVLPEKKVNTYFDDLVSASIIQKAETDGRIKCGFVIHKLLYDLAQTVCGEEFLKLENKILQISGDVRYLSIIGDKLGNTIDLQLLQQLKDLPESFKHLRVLIFNNIHTDDLSDLIGNLRQLSYLSLRNSGTKDLPKSVFHLYNLLNLDLMDCPIKEMPNSISNFKQLRSLNIRHTCIKCLPESIGLLVQLVNLDLMDCDIRELPKGIVQLIKLEQLKLNWWRSVCMPSGIRQLTKLVNLARFEIRKGDWHCKISELASLVNLKGHLCISGLRNVTNNREVELANLKDKPHLRALRLELSSELCEISNHCNTMEGQTHLRNADFTMLDLEVLESLRPHTNLEYLQIISYGGYRLPSWLSDVSFSKLLKIVLVGREEGCEHLAALGMLPHLRVLSISSFWSVEFVRHEFCSLNGVVRGFQSLKTLVFDDMVKWKEWSGVQIGEFCSLELLKILDCPNLSSIPEQLSSPSFTKLFMKDCFMLDKLPKFSSISVLVLKGQLNPSIFTCLDLPLLRTMKICCSHNIRSLPLNHEKLIHLKMLIVHACRNLRNLIGLGDLKALKIIKISACESIQFSLHEKLPVSLKHIDISDCSKLQKWKQICKNKYFEKFYGSDEADDEIEAFAELGEVDGDFEEELNGVDDWDVDMGESILDIEPREGHTTYPQKNVQDQNANEISEKRLPVRPPVLPDFEDLDVVGLDVDKAISALQQLEHAAFVRMVELNEVSDQIVPMQRNLKLLKVFVMDADTTQQKNESVMKWVNQVRELAYRIEVAVETFRNEIKQNWSKSYLLKVEMVFKYPIELDKLSGELKNISEEMERILEIRTQLGITDLGSGPGGSGSGQPAILPFGPTKPIHTDDSEVVGFNSNKDEIISHLLDKNISRRTVLSIVGVGGLGKTTLAHKVYKSAELNTQFSCRAWLSISQNFDENKLCREIIYSVEPTMKETDLSDERVWEELVKSLRGKRYLIILDDVWTVNLWKRLKMGLPDEKNASRVIITTRNHEVATAADRHTRPHELHYLDEKESLALLFRKALQQDIQPNKYPSHLVNIAKKLMETCGGLPLALVVLGGMLSTKPNTYTAWEKVYNTFDWHNNEQGIKCLQILRMSYQDLSYEKKRCFQYFAAFPEDHKILAKDITRMWIAEELIPKDGRGTLEDQAEDYLADLINRCLVQVIKKSWNGYCKICGMHDLLRDLAIHEARIKKLLVVLSKDADNQLITEKTRRVALQFKTPTGFDIQSTKIRSLLCFRGSLLNYQGFKRLRVLVIEDVNLDNIEVGKTWLEGSVHMKYLEFRDCHSDKNIVANISFNSMKNLETFASDGIGFECNNFSSVWEDVPTLRHVICNEEESISCPLRWDNLRNLQTLKWGEFKGIPKFRGKVNLRTLKIHLIESTEAHEESENEEVEESKRDGEDGEESEDEEGEESEDEEGEESKIEDEKGEENEDEEVEESKDEEGEYIKGYKEISWKGLKVLLSQTEHLVTLAIVSCRILFETLGMRKLPCYETIQCLHLCGKWQGVLSFQMFPKNLTKLKLDNTGLRKDPMPILERLQCLKILRFLPFSYYGGKMTCSRGGFPSLQKLFFKRSLSEWEIKEGAMPVLSQLEIYYCNLSTLPNLQFVPSLRQLDMGGISTKLHRRLRLEDLYKIKHIPSLNIYGHTD